MIKRILIFLSICFVANLRGQISGVVLDSITGEKLPLVNISVLGENKGTTSELDGTFSLGENAGKKLVFSILGYQKKTLQAQNNMRVLLQADEIALSEVVVENRKKTKKIEIGPEAPSIYEAYNRGPRTDTRFFEYLSSYNKARYIDAIIVRTDSKVKEARFIIHLYEPDKNGFPGKEMLNQNLVVSVDKGIKNTLFRLEKFHLKMPKTGLFVGIEKLMIESNKLETDNPYQSGVYYPLILYSSAEKDKIFSYSGGQWHVQTKQNQEGVLEKIKTSEPAISLILTN
ncbi:carboxypeptidase-like regulatory domain-containing protein [Flavobacterium sp. CYK-55]|uniref:carboxypeptidase-like regulatory domain-containing protein n=1 Tax=Flavobacterium sp. CYK-55 TaxID=2835529 RepID=UPI001BCB031D|nr:carboxypeptidase-like regulatory domain-containing protein [Flavobacterium sp. CYK-55]MBS7786166.1 carboxypeptidase-like regulatory domain-containing protein [Flavobacterium sp. CYK-55]